MSSGSESEDELTTDITQWQRRDAPKRKSSELQPVSRPVKERGNLIRVTVSTPVNIERDEYEDYTQVANVVKQVLSKRSEGNRVVYKVLFEDSHTEKVGLIPLAIEPGRLAHALTDAYLQIRL